MPPICKITANYMRTSPRLRRYFAGIFLIEIDVENGEVVEDFMFPDWATLRFNQSPSIAGNTREGEAIGTSTLSVSGPRSQEVYVRTGSLRQWGVLIHPVGWVSLIGKPANEYANRLVDGFVDPVFERFRPLARTLFGPKPDPAAELARLTEFFFGLTPFEDPAVDTIDAVFEALKDPEIESVTALVERVGTGRRTLERLCLRSFGFPPKTLLRRQRFMRSLTHFTMDPSLKWIGALDASYHDQAQFVRDFRDFMGMTPSEYGRRYKPVVEPVIHERVRFSNELAASRAQVWAASGI